MGGFIQIDRKILKWEWYQDIKVFHLFLYLILRANWEDGRWQGKEVKRGQLITGRLKLAADTGLSEREIRTCLNKLKTTGEITIRTTNKNSIITICKYDTYQSKYGQQDQQKDTLLDQRETNKRPAKDQQATINNNTNNNKEEEEIKEGSEKSPFWFLKIKLMPYQQYSELHGKFAASENHFIAWKEFIDWIYEKNHISLFESKFINPKDFGELVEAGFVEPEYREQVILRMLGTGIKPEHELKYRIPQFMQYVNQENKRNERDQKTRTTRTEQHNSALQSLLERGKKRFAAAGS